MAIADSHQRLKLNSYERRARKRYAWKRGNRRCRWCGRRLKLRDVTLDRWPICGHMGGRYIKANIVAACFKCNRARCNDQLMCYVKLSVYRLQERMTRFAE